MENCPIEKCGFGPKNFEVVHYTSLGIPNEPSFQFGDISNNYLKNNMIVCQNPPNSPSYLPSLHLQSLQWNLLSIKCPITWEITEGNKNTVANIYDGWNGTNITTSPSNSHGNNSNGTSDIFMQWDKYKPMNEWDCVEMYDETTDEYGNVRVDGNVFHQTYYPCFYQLNPDGQGQQFRDVRQANNFGYGGITLPLTDASCNSHGYGTISTLVSKMNSNGLVGIAPNSKVICSTFNPQSSQYLQWLDAGSPTEWDGNSSYQMYSSLWDFTIDPRNFETNTAGRLLPIVCNISAESDLEVINNNISEALTKTLTLPINNSTYDFNVVSGMKLGRIQIEGISETKTKKVITVGSTTDGNYIKDINNNPLNISWDPRLTTTKYWDHTAEISFEFDGYNYLSEMVDFGTTPQKILINSNNKISTNTNIALDVVAPGASITLPAHTGHYIQSYDLFPNNPNGFSQVNGTYFKSDLGSSSAIPHVTGTILLMHSAGLANFSISGYPFTKEYDIITLTADKIDPIFPIAVPPNSNKTKEEMVEYKLQTDDPLHRYWSRNTGFGKINTFRCVAQSIPAKGLQIYTQSLTLGNGFPIINDNQTRYNIHFGAFNEVSNEKILVGGGLIYPGEPAYMNNNGITIFDNNNPDESVHVCVPNDYNLVIDGILKSTSYNINYDLNNDKIYSSGSGKILITGYLEDVELNGLIKMEDLKIYSNILRTDYQNNVMNPGCGRIIINSTNCDNGSSEIYGKVIINGNGFIGFSVPSENCNKLVMKPGSALEFKGYNGMNIEANAVLEMEYGSKIINNNGLHQFINIKNNGKMIIKSGAAVTIDCPIIIEDGGKLIFEDHTLAWIDNITIQKGGQLVGVSETAYTLDNEVVLIPTKTKMGKIIIEPGAILKINNSINSTTLPDVPIVLLGGIVVKGQLVLPDFPNNPYRNEGLFLVENFSLLDLGPIISEKYSRIKINPGSRINIFRNSYDPVTELPEYDIAGNRNYFKGLSYSYIDGTLVIGSPIDNSPKVYLIGLNTYQDLHTNILYNSDRYFNNINWGIENYIFSIINCSSKYSSPFFNDGDYVEINNTEFRNTVLQLFNCNKNPLLYCDFYFNSNELKKQLSGPDNWLFTYLPSYILRSHNDRPYFSVNNIPPTFLNLSLINCTFKDEAANIQTEEFKNWLIDRKPPGDPDIYNAKYHFTGVLAQNMRKVSIDNSGISGTIDQFKGLNYSIKTENCAIVDIHNTKHSQSRVGVADAHGSIMLCQNTTSQTQIPFELDNSKSFVKSYDNNLTEFLYGIRLDNTYEQISRSSSFSEFVNGINVQKGQAFLNDDAYYYSIPNYGYEEGRNEFIVSIPINNIFIETEFYNNEYTGKQSDIYLLNQDAPEQSKAFISCGENLLSQYSNNHINNDKNTVFDNIVIDGHNNNYRGVDAPRVWNVDLTGTIFNYPISVGDIPDCNPPEIISDNCVNSNYGCTYFRNNVNWNLLQDDSTVADAEFYSALTDFCDGQLSCDCYELKVRDLIQWATLDANSDSTEDKLMLIRACLQEKRNDSLSAFFSCAGDLIIMSLGEIEERMGNYQGAKKHYQDIHYFFPFTIDTMYAQWRYLYCEAMTIDTTFGAQYDSAMSVYLHRVAADISRKDTSTTPPGGQYKIGFDKELDEAPALPPDPDYGEIESIAPNPLTNETVVRYRLEQECDIELIIYDWLGKEIKTLVKGRYKKGNYVVTFQNEGYANSSYMCALRFNGAPGQVKIMQIVK